MTKVPFLSVKGYVVPPALGCDVPPNKVARIIEVTFDFARNMLEDLAVSPMHERLDDVQTRKDEETRLLTIAD